MKTQLETLSTHDLKLGMFIAELDRPAHQTPFPVQGFHINNEKELLALKHFCKLVKVDLVKSSVVGDVSKSLSIAPIDGDHLSEVNLLAATTKGKPRRTIKKKFRPFKRVRLSLATIFPWACMGAIAFHYFHNNVMPLI